jgi:hypothetical protein
MEEFTRCSVCTRTPLVGEGITVMARGHRESIVCDLCRDRPRASTLGDPARRERVRTAAGALNVRRVWPSPVTEPVAPVEVR